MEKEVKKENVFVVYRYIHEIDTFTLLEKVYLENNSQAEKVKLQIACEKWSDRFEVCDISSGYSVSYGFMSISEWWYKVDCGESL